ncbi:hypothetical protein [Nostoc sp.]|uniref:hypothetical protein n=1 Tax=Nostoc sp. TaxID=1180 RepID=UPI002FF4DBEE
MSQFGLQGAIALEQLKPKHQRNGRVQKSFSHFSFILGIHPYWKHLKNVLSFGSTKVLAQLRLSLRSLLNRNERGMAV